MISRKDFLKRMVAASSTAFIPGMVHWSCTPESKTEENEAPLLLFDMHCHPGQFFFKNLELYAGDEGVMKTINEMNQGGLTGGFVSMVSDMLVLQRTETGIVQARTFGPGEALADIQRQLKIIKELIPSLNAQIGIGLEDLKSDANNVSLFLACEGGDFIEEDIANVDLIYQEGVRSIQLVHYAGNKIGDLQTQAPAHDGLSDLGKNVVQKMNELGMVIDVAHASFKTVQDVAGISSQPLILSHSILKMDEERPISARAITVEHAKVIAETGGVIGAWPSGFNKSFDEYVDNILRLVDTIGIDHVGIGTDMDSNFRPVMDSYLQLDDLVSALKSKGLSNEEVSKLGGGNVLRVLKAVF